MRIVCKDAQRDYFHRVGKRFGEDPRHVYVVKKFDSADFDAGGLISVDEALKLTPDVWRRPPREEEIGLRRWRPGIIIAGAIAVCVMRHPIERRGELLVEKHYGLMHHAPWVNRADDWRPPDIDEELVHRAQRVVGAPVFMIDGIRWGYDAQHRKQPIIRVSPEIPIMRNYGVPAVCSAEQMWQSVEHVITSVLKKSPDLEPPLKISNDEKIIAAGFDLKTSFRGKS